MSDPDLQLDLKKRARRRLVGALALTLAAAVSLPMVMESEPKPVGNELQIRIPSQEGANYASRLIAAPPPVPPLDEKPQEAVAPNEISSVPLAQVPLPDAVPAPVAAPVLKPEVAKPATSAAAIKPAAPVPAKPDSQDEAKRAAMILAGKTPPTSTTQKATASGAFYVQLGAYRDTANVKSLQTRLKKAGFSSTTESLGDRTRVRIGPFDSRAAADKALAKLKAAGMSGAVTAP